MATKDSRVTPEVTDISSADQLLSYATAGQLAQLQRQQPYLSQNKIAYGARLGGQAPDGRPGAHHRDQGGPALEPAGKAG